MSRKRKRLDGNDLNSTLFRYFKVNGMNSKKQEMPSKSQIWKDFINIDSDSEEVQVPPKNIKKINSNFIENSDLGFGLPKDTDNKHDMNSCNMFGTVEPAHDFPKEINSFYALDSLHSLKQSSTISSAKSAPFGKPWLLLGSSPKQDSLSTISTSINLEDVENLGFPRVDNAYVTTFGHSIPADLSEGTGIAVGYYGKLRASLELDVAQQVQLKAIPLSKEGDENHQKVPFYKVLQGMPIAVDAFAYGMIPGVTAYFLSHAHSDHYTKLNSTWNSGPIYCSEATAKLILHMLAVDPIWVHPLPMDQQSVVPNSGDVSVTLIDANHCPGSAIFLFEGPQTVHVGDSLFKSPFIGSSRVFRYLHCGDFRASPKHVLHPAIHTKKIDYVYLDTTYLDPKYTFPPQSSVISACAELSQRLACGKAVIPENVLSMSAWVKSTWPWEVNKTLSTLFVVGTYTIGKERVAKAIAHALSGKIYCDARKKAILHCQVDYELDALLTSDPLNAAVHLVPMHMLTTDKLRTYLQRFKGTFLKVVGFRPTGWAHVPSSSSEQEQTTTISYILSHPNRNFSYANLRPTSQSASCLKLFPVPYSEHSSFFELTCFAMSFNWTRVVPTVNVGSAHSRNNIANWVAKWQVERKKRGKVELVPYRNPDYW